MVKEKRRQVILFTLAIYLMNLIKLTSWKQLICKEQWHIANCQTALASMLSTTVGISNLMQLAQHLLVVAIWRAPFE